MLEIGYINFQQHMVYILNILHIGIITISIKHLYFENTISI